MESGQTGRPEGLWKEGMSPRLLCRFGCNCRAKLNCLWVHKPKVQQWFVDEQALLQRRMMMECLFCARGECKYGERCMRSQRAREMRTSVYHLKVYELKVYEPKVYEPEGIRTKVYELKIQFYSNLSFVALLRTQSASDPRVLFLY